MPSPHYRSYEWGQIFYVLIKKFCRKWLCIVPYASYVTSGYFGTLINPRHRFNLLLWYSLPNDCHCPHVCWAYSWKDSEYNFFSNKFSSTAVTWRRFYWISWWVVTLESQTPKFDNKETLVRYGCFTMSYAPKKFGLLFPSANGSF